VKRPCKRVYVLAAIVAVVCLVPLIFCCGIPLITGQACLDFMSSHVPPRAARQYMEMVFAATIAEDYGWLSTVTDQEAMEDLQEVRPHVSTDFEIVFRDNLAGLYEYRVRFQDGTVAYVTLWGEWPQCPDFWVTKDEICQNIELSSIHVDENWDPSD
jgi:hypothetical protein